MQSPAKTLLVGSVLIISALTPSIAFLEGNYGNDAVTTGQTCNVVFGKKMQKMEDAKRVKDVESAKIYVKNAVIQALKEVSRATKEEKAMYTAFLENARKNYITALDAAVVVRKASIQKSFDDWYEFCGDTPREEGEMYDFLIRSIVAVQKNFNKSVEKTRKDFLSAAAKAKPKIKLPNSGQKF